VFYTDNSESVSVSGVDALNTAGGRKDAGIRQACTDADGKRLIIGYYCGALGEDTSATTDQAADTDEPYTL
jgi:hypothetical protein